MRTRAQSNNLQTALDTSGSVLSLLCAAHCVLLPALIALLPSLGLKWLMQGWVHLLLLGLVFPIASFALVRGYQNHKQSWILYTGGAGLALLLVAVIWGHALHAESAMTVAGSLLLVASHAGNYRECRKACAPADD